MNTQNRQRRGEQKRVPTGAETKEFGPGWQWVHTGDQLATGALPTSAKVSQQVLYLIISVTLRLIFQYYSFIIFTSDYLLLSSIIHSFLLLLFIIYYYYHLLFFIIY